MFARMSDVKPYIRFERDRGFRDPNAQFSPAQLYGTGPRSLGLYYRMRETYDTIRAAMDERYRQMRRITYEVRPRDPNPTEAQRQAAELVGSVLTRMPHMPLSKLAADVDDRRASYGHALGHLESDGESLNIVWIEPYQIREFVTDFFGRQLVGVRYDTGFGWVFIPAPQLVWFGNMRELGNFWGSAELRGLVADFVGYDQEIRTHMDERVTQAGTIYAQENEHGASDDQVDRVADWIGDLYAGKRAPIKLPLGIDLNVLNAPASSAGTSGTVPMLQFFDSKVREYLGTMLGSLGISGVGARALGETFEISDRDKFLSHADDVCSVISGTDNANTRLIRTIGDWFGIDPGDDPVIGVAERPARSSDGRIASFVSLVQSGIFPADRITDELRRELVEGDLGLPFPDGEERAATGDGVIDANGTADLYYPPESVMDAAASGKARRLDVPKDARPKTWIADVSTASRLASGDGFRVGEIREIAARIRAIDPTAPGADIRRDMLGGDDVFSWLEQVVSGNAV